MLLFNNSCVGGAERRYAQVFEHFRRRHVPISLAINESLFTALTRAGILVENRPDLILKERVGRLATWLFRKQGGSDKTMGLSRASRVFNSTIWGLRKLDYAIGCFTVGWWVLRRRPQVLHLVLGGAYMAFPLQLMRCAPPSVTSVVCPTLRGMVGSGLGYHVYRLALRCAQVVDALTDPIRLALEQEGISPQCIRVSSGSFVNTARFSPAPGETSLGCLCGKTHSRKKP
jgi:hypothetical protein